MDVEMPVMNGVESTRQIKKRFPGIQVLILSTFSQDDCIVDGLAFGACGYLLKDTRTEELAAHIRQAVHGQLLLSGPILRSWLIGSNSCSAPVPSRHRRRRISLSGCRRC
jgi:NarL family two-component system response regulator YdfI